MDIIFASTAVIRIKIHISGYHTNRTDARKDAFEEQECGWCSDTGMKC